MSPARCPHCGVVNFSIVGWSDLDHCASCGKSLASREPRIAQARVQEDLAFRSPERPRRSARGTADKERNP